MDIIRRAVPRYCLAALLLAVPSQALYLAEVLWSEGLFSKPCSTVENVGGHATHLED